MLETETKERKGERSASHSPVTWGWLGGALILNPGGTPVVFTLYMLAAPASGKKSSIEEKREGEMSNTCVKFGLSQKWQPGLSVCVCVFVADASKDIASASEIRREGWKSKLTHHAVTFAKRRGPAGESKREREAQEGRQNAADSLQACSLTTQLRYH